MKNPQAQLPGGIASRWNVVPLSEEDDGSIVVAALDADNPDTLENLKNYFDAPIKLVPHSAQEMESMLRERYGLGAGAVHLGEAAMVSFVDDLVLQAHRERATDIHIEPFEDELTVRFRVDGIMYPVRVPDSLPRFKAALVSRIKVMAQMNIAEKRLPQDGRIRFKVQSDDLDIRVSIIPTIYGESVDLRLLPRVRMVMGLEQLGMAESEREKMSRLIRRANGIILVTGPTGHGKTTTLYACLSQINTPDKKIITVEDPVEYRLRGVNQIQTHPKIGLTFASGLRSILRQDPDVIMVGEIRDSDTAEVAIRASLTGHLVFSTLHTNDAVGAIVRLIDMGVEPYLVASSINAVLAQRLVRRVCPNCKAPGNTCSTCRGSGYSGRTGIFELFLVTEAMRDLILSKASSLELRRRASTDGMRTLLEEGLRKVSSGVTTRDEIMRVTEGM